MNRLARRVSGLIVVVSLAFALPPAEARSVTPWAARSAAESWTSTWVRWIDNFFSNPARPAARSTPAQRKTGADLGLPLPPIELPIGTGLCIDPNGHPIGCNQG